MYCCDRCGEPLLTEYFSLNFIGHAYILESVFSDTYKWVEGEPSQDFHLCKNCADKLFSEWFTYRAKIIEEVINESESSE